LIHCKNRPTEKVYFYYAKLGIQDFFCGPFGGVANTVSVVACIMFACATDKAHGLDQNKIKWAGWATEP